MKTMRFADAVDAALAHAMERDERIVVFGEDVEGLRLGLAARFGKKRVRSTPISESAFLGAGVAAAMAGLRPVVEIMMADFILVAADALFNHAAKVETFSGGRWKVPLVVRVACGGGYGDGGQHEQSLWGWLAHVPGLAVVAPSTPADAAGLMLAALGAERPVVFLEHKLLAANWLEALGSGGRTTLRFDVPAAGAEGPVPDPIDIVKIGKAAIRRQGEDITFVGVSVDVHRSVEAARELERDGIQAEVVDLRTITPLDREAIASSLAKTRRLLVVDEDYEGFGLSGELAAIALESGLAPRYARVCTRETIPYARELERETLPSVQRIIDAAKRLMEERT